MTITPKQQRWLRQQAQQLKPVVLLGHHGLTAAVLKEIDGALVAHELIKVRVNAGDRVERQALIDTIATHSDAVIIQHIGNVACYYRANPKHRHPLVLPKQ